MPLSNQGGQLFSPVRIPNGIALFLLARFFSSALTEFSPLFSYVLALRVPALGAASISSSRTHALTGCCEWSSRVVMALAARQWLLIAPLDEANIRRDVPIEPSVRRSLPLID